MNLDLNGLVGLTLRLNGVTLTPRQLELAWPTWQRYLDGHIAKGPAISGIKKTLRKHEVPLGGDGDDDEDV